MKFIIFLLILQVKINYAVFDIMGPITKIIIKDQPLDEIVLTDVDASVFYN